VTDDAIVALGSFCETHMCHSAWAVVVKQFEQHCFQRIMTPHEQKKREDIYKTHCCSHRLAPQAAGLDANSLGPLTCAQASGEPEDQRGLGAENE
jgi:hypothetical protein